MIESPVLRGDAQPIIAAVDNGASRTRVVLLQGAVELGRTAYDTPQDYQKGIDRLGLSLALLRSDYLGNSNHPINVIGIAAAGKVENGVIVSAGALEDYGWTGHPFQRDVASELKTESGLVVVKNDCVMAALAQRVQNSKIDGPNVGYVETISTGNGGSYFVFDGEPGKTEFDDEPGHEFLKPGVICGCGINGHVEAHIAGYGIERKFGKKAEDPEMDHWPEIVDDTVEAHVRLINRLANRGVRPAVIYLFGSVATKQPYLVMPGLQRGLLERQDQIPYIPTIAYATHGDNGGLVGAGDAARELLYQAA